MLTLTTLALACRADPVAFADRFTTPAERQFSLDYLALLESQRIDSAFALLIPELQSDTVRQQLVAVATILANHPLDSTSLIGVQLQSTAGTRFVNLSWEYPSHGQWIATNVAARYSPPTPARVAGFSAQLLVQSLRTLNRFTLQDRSVVHIVWLVAVIGMPLFCLTVAARVLTTRGMPKRWIWALVALVGVARFSLNWTTADVAVSPLYLTLFAAGATKAGPAAPWILSFALPLGAVLALVRYRRWIAIHQDTGAPDVVEAAV